jgi:hypothetical protein
VSSNLAAPTTFEWRWIVFHPRMSALHATVMEAFKSMGWQYRVVAGQEVIECAFEAHHTKVLLHAQSHPSAGVVTIVATSSLHAQHSHLRAVSELIMRTNKQLNVGAFEFDWDSGQVLFRVSNVFAEGTANARIIAGLAHSAVAEMDRLTPFLSELLRVSTLELPVFSISELLARQDLLPRLEQPATA